jgi:DNA-binding response OmpR family regulator
MADESIQHLKAFVVEDQPMVASILMDALSTTGIAVVGHAYDVPDAFAWLDRGVVPDLALVDVMLPSGTAYPIVDRLRNLPTATLLITGMTCDQIPAAYQDLPCLEKPFGMHALLKAVAALR